MLSHTLPKMGLFSRGAPKTTKSIIEGHFWGLTRYRIGPRFLGLDSAGNVLFFRNYRQQGFGGWRAITLGAANDSFLSSETSGTNVLEDGHPMHYKACQRLQVVIDGEKKKWKAAQEKKRAEAAKAEAEKAAAADGSAKTSESGASADGASAAKTTVRDAAGLYESDEQQFRDVLAIKLSHPSFYQRHLQISKVATWSYKLLYYYLWAVLLSLLAQGYLMFRAWLNPAAREGLIHLEDHALHFPRLLFSLVVYGLAAAVRAAKPLLDPLFGLAQPYFPVVMNFSPDAVATRATKVADHAHPKAKEREAQQAKERQQRERLRAQQEQQRRSWWSRALLVLLALFGILSVI